MSTASGCLALAFTMAVGYDQAAMAQPTDAKLMIDLTYPFDEQTIYWPTEDGFRLQLGEGSEIAEGFYSTANRFECAEHGGTHIDAPRHFLADGQTVDQIPLSRLVGPAACVDASQRCLADPDYQVAVEDFEAWERQTGATLEGRIVLIRTGYGRYWPDREKYLGTTETGEAAIAQLRFPGLAPSAAEWLITERHVRMVGIDTASIDHGQTRDFPTHQRLLRNEVPALENLARLDELPANGFSVVALPIKISGGTGGPCRVVAILDQ